MEIKLRSSKLYIETNSHTLYSFLIRPRKTSWGSTTRRDHAVMVHTHFPYQKYVGCTTLIHVYDLLDDLGLSSKLAKEVAKDRGWGEML